MRPRHPGELMHNRLTPVADSNVTFRDPFWAPRRKVNRETTMAREYELLREGCTPPQPQDRAAMLEGIEVLVFDLPL